LLTLAAALSACTTDGLFSSDKVDYRAKTAKSKPLDVPPDLSQLARDSRYQPQNGVVSAAATPGATPAAAGTPSVAVQARAGLRVEREGNTRWLVSAQTPEQLWPQIKAFWLERGLPITTENAEAGVMETDWAENRAKIPTDFIRNTIGRLFDTLYSSGERDRYRVRVERTAAGSEVYIAHRGLEEVYLNNSQRTDGTAWRARPNDPQLEAEMLTRLMVKLGAREDTTRTAAASPAAAATPAAAPAAPRARLVAGSNTLQVDDNFDRAWRRVGLALDRGGFTVEDRDRNAGLYYVRYVDPKYAGKEDPNIFARLFGSADTATALKYRIEVKTAGSTSTVRVLNAQGAADDTANGKRIAELLANELK
jgi:outer membrane protein assembly factor BamC